MTQSIIRHSLKLHRVGGCLSEDVGLRLRTEERVEEFNGATEGQPKVQGMGGGEKEQLVYAAF